MKQMKKGPCFLDLIHRLCIFFLSLKAENSPAVDCIVTWECTVQGGSLEEFQHCRAAFMITMLLIMLTTNVERQLFVDF